MAAPLVLAATIAGGPWFALLVLTVLTISVLEISALTRRAGLLPSSVAGLAAAVSLPLGAAIGDVRAAWIAVGIAIAAGTWSSLRNVGQSEALLGWAVSLATGLYVGGLLAPSIALRDRPDGLGWMTMILAATWACDIVAFLIGRRWGRHKLAPLVSPGKSIEGAIAGAFAATLIGLAAGAFVAQPTLRLVGLGLLVGIGAVLGDLAESALKRQLEAKDSGWIMPGHGGLLDRIDSLLVTSFLGYWYVLMTDGVWPS